MYNRRPHIVILCLPHGGARNRLKTWMMLHAITAELGAISTCSGNLKDESGSRHPSKRCTCSTSLQTSEACSHAEGRLLWGLATTLTGIFCGTKACRAAQKARRISTPLALSSNSRRSAMPGNIVLPTSPKALKSRRQPRWPPLRTMFLKRSLRRSMSQACRIHHVGVNIHML